MKQIYSLDNIEKLDFKLKIPYLIYLEGDLGAGKTTLSKHIINNILKVKDEVKSPTYTYYNKYIGEYNGKKIDIIHFDLYRLKDYDGFFAIGGEDILDNNDGIILIEWPKIIKKYYKPDLEIIFKITENEDERELEMTLQTN